MATISPVRPLDPVSRPELRLVRSPVRRRDPRRILQITLGALWLLDAGLQYQPSMFRPDWVGDVIEGGAKGNPHVVAGPVLWSAHLMVHHIALYNAVFASIQLLLGAGLIWKRSVRLALVGSVVWALLVWWFGETLTGTLSGGTPLMGEPGCVLYAVVAVLLWPRRDRTAGTDRAFSPAESGPLGRRAALGVWSLLWASCAWFLLLTDNRAPHAISDSISAMSGGEPAWVRHVLSALASSPLRHGLAASIALAVGCLILAGAVWVPGLRRPVVVLAAAFGLLAFTAQAFGGIFTGSGTDPGSGPLLVLLALCFWPTVRPGLGTPRTAVGA